MTYIEESINKIRAYVNSNGLTKSGLSKLAGLSKNALHNFDREDWNPRADTLRKLENLINT
jgi:3,4-dihydroxy 2-butanone 4-phosphate synthase / GTP cyclohydrolase II